MRTTFQMHDGVRICHLDFSNTSGEPEVLAAIAELKKVIAAEPPRSVYTITNVANSIVTSRIRAALQDLTTHNKPFVIFGAVTGLSGIQRVILRGIIQLTGRRLVAAESMEAAVEAVVREAKGAK